MLWSCTNCGACVDAVPGRHLEHVDHILDMRRYQVLVEAELPGRGPEPAVPGLETKGNPWNMSPTTRADWAKDLPVRRADRRARTHETM